MLIPLVLLYLIILIEGFISISVEMLTIRQLIPVVGNSVIVTSLIIGIFLLFLACGYHRGGTYKKDFKKILRKNFALAALWLGIGLSYTFISVLFYCFQKFSDVHIVYFLVTYLLVITAPLVYFLGQTIPISMNLVKQEHSIGTIGGNILGISTLGSFFGAIATTLLLMNYLGVAWTIFINFVALVFLALALSEKKSSLVIWSGIAGALLYGIYAINIGAEKKLFVLTDAYASYQILDASRVIPKTNGKILSINDSFSSYTNAQKKGFDYIEAIKKFLFADKQLRNRDILVLGAGGFTLSAENTFGNRFTYVDIDSRIQKVVVPLFLEKINGSVIIDDARHFLLTTPAHYDVIVSDVYTNEAIIPAHLVTQEYFAAVKNKLKDDGIAVMNIIADPSFSDAYSKRIDNTIRQVFTSCAISPLSYSDGGTNIIYLCENNRKQQDPAIYSDDRNQATLDYFAWKQSFS